MEYINKIIQLLAQLSSEIKLSNTRNLTDINIHSESFYKNLLNKIYPYKLNNININDQNIEAIDLGDTINKIAFQVTATATIEKVKNTVRLFISKKLYEHYERLIILNIVEKKKHRETSIGDVDKFQLNTRNDIWDKQNLISRIQNLNLKEIEDIYTFLNDELNISRPKTLSNEVKTFLSLIEYLSDENHPSVGQGFIEAPDPERKIYTRFEDHSEFLTNEYETLYIDYGIMYNDIMQQTDLGPVRIRRLGYYLKSFSDGILDECNNNAKLALSKVVEKLKNMLSENSVNYDECAIKFFVLQQLINCNVFPNK